MNTESLDVECAASSVAASSEIDSDQNSQSNVVNVDPNQKQTNVPQTPVQAGGSAAAADPNSKPVQTNLQRIKQQKQDVYNWPRNKKLLKLAMYSSCQVGHIFGIVQYKFYLRG